MKNAQFLLLVVVCCQLAAVGWGGLPKLGGLKDLGLGKKKILEEPCDEDDGKKDLGGILDLKDGLKGLGGLGGLGDGLGGLAGGWGGLGDSSGDRSGGWGGPSWDSPKSRGWDGSKDKKKGGKSESLSLETVDKKDELRSLKMKDTKKESGW